MVTGTGLLSLDPRYSKSPPYLAKISYEPTGRSALTSVAESPLTGAVPSVCGVRPTKRQNVTVPVASLTRKCAVRVTGCSYWIAVLRSASSEISGITRVSVSPELLLGRKPMHPE